MGALKNERLRCDVDGMLEALREGCRAHAGKSAAIDEHASVTYAGAYWGARRLAQRLRAMGVGRGDVVMLCMGNCASFVVVVAACEAVGASMAFTPPTIAAQEMKRRLDLLKPAVCIMDASCDFGTAFESCDAILISSSEVLASASDDYAALDASATAFDDNREGCRVIVFTSGSTGLPKAIECDLSAFFHNARCMNESYGAVADDVFFMPPPFSHVFGFLGVCASVTAGATLVTLGRYSPAAAAAMVFSCRATIEYGVSTMLLRQLRAPGERESLRTLKTFVVGGDSCPSDLLIDFEQRFGCRVVQSWGMSEASSTLTAMPLGAGRELRSKSVGCAIDGVELSLDEASGELLCRAPTLARGVLDERGLHALSVDSQGWFHTGDVGSIDEAGMVRIRGRIKDIVVRGGVNIYPAEVERVYRENPAVVDCCLVGFADEELGERTCLCAVVSESCAQQGDSTAVPSSRELRLWARGRIEKCRIPDIVLPVAALPLLPNGKVDKPELRSFVQQWIDKHSPQFNR